MSEVSLPIIVGIWAVTLVIAWYIGWRMGDR